MKDLAQNLYFYNENVVLWNIRYRRKPHHNIKLIDVSIVVQGDKSTKVSILFPQGSHVNDLLKAIRGSDGIEGALALAVRNLQHAVFAIHLAVTLIAGQLP